MDIKIVTCHYAYNYGAVLQAYALCKVLNDCGNNAKVINYRPWYYKGSTKTKNKVKLLLRKVIRIPDNYKSEIVFYGFLKKYVPLTAEYKNYEEVERSEGEADLFIAGSDQIWNFNLPNGNDDVFYLGFVKKGIKSSYAASLGMNHLTNEQLVTLKDKLKSFDYVSLREKSAKNILDATGLRDIQVVSDPVYLLSRDEWNSISKKPDNMPSGKYVLVYAFNRQKEIFDFGKNLAQKYGFKVLSVNTFWEDILNKTDHYFWNCMPEEFLYLVSHAECVVTNSFHGLSFSMIFNRPVILFEKDDRGNSRMNDLIDVLDAYTVKDKNVKEQVVIPKINFTTINRNINAYRTQSIQYLDLLTRGITKNEDSM